ncbi:MAG: alpha/beta hydrolase family protein [Bacteroidia bacterium]
MKTSLFTLFLTFFALCTYAQKLTGRYEGAVSRDGSIQLVNFDFFVDGKIQKGTYEIPENGSFDVPIDEILFKNDTLCLRFYFGNFFCFYDTLKTQITGISEKWDPKIRLHVKKSSEVNKPYRKEEITFTNNNVSLSGMLYHPVQSNNTNTKYVILVHGSGAQNRFSPYYISLGYALSKRGFGVLLYDKRGTGKSTGDYLTASMQDLAGDANAAMKYLRNRNDLKIDEVGYLGTSQGGWVASIAANNTEKCDFLILNVGPAVSVFDQDMHRVEYSMKNDGWEQTSIDSALAYTKLYFIYAQSNKNTDWKKLENMIEQTQSKPWAEYLNFPENKDDFTWWRLNNFDPKNTLTKIPCRTLAIFGENDVLVPPIENKTKMEEYLTMAGVNFDIVVIEGATHDMRTYHGLNGNNWNWPQVYWQWRIQPTSYIESITEFLVNSKK